MTAATGFKRLGMALVAAMLVGGGALIALTYLVSADTVRARVMTEIRRVTGLDPIMRGPATVSLFPSGSVSFADVALGDAGHPALTTKRLVARLRFLPLLIGRVEIADVSLDRPTITIDIAPGGHTNWSGLMDALARSQTPNPFPLNAFSEIRIERGTIVLRDAAHKITETLHDAEFSLAWPSISKGFGATGRFRWNGEEVEASLTLADFAAALTGKHTGVKLRLSGAPLKLAFDGAASTDPTLKVEGTLAADAQSLRDALVWTHLPPPPGGGFGPFALKAKTNLVSGKIALTNVNVELDGNNAEGVLTFVTDGRQTLQGTLASETLDLTPYVSTIRLFNRREWSSREIALDGLSGFDLDLRLSAANVIVSDAKLGRTAIGANLRNGQLVVTVGESQAFGGVIKGSLALTRLEAGVDVKAKLNFNDVNLETCLEQLFGMRKLEGKGNIAFAVEGSGESVMGVTRTLNGSATLTGQEGALVGINVEQLLRRLERRPLSGGGSFRSGRTPYQRIEITMKIGHGTVTIEDMKIVGAAVNLALAGTASIPERDLDLTGTAALVTAEKDAADPPFELPFIVNGSWDDPVMLPDVDILIRRSGAAAPLLRAVRETAKPAAAQPQAAAPAAPAATAADAAPSQQAKPPE